MRTLFLFLMAVLILNAGAQTTDSTAKAAEKAKRAAREKAFLARADYPYIKSSKFSGVIPVKDAEKLDPNLQYKLLLEVVSGINDSAEAKDINNGLADAARIINLHVAGGVPLKNLHPVILVHGPAVKALLKNDAYRQIFKTDNPNLVLFKELQDDGIPIIACGQAMFFFDVPQQDIVPGVKVALSAKTTLTSYQMKGYILHAGL